MKNETEKAPKIMTSGGKTILSPPKPATTLKDAGEVTKTLIEKMKKQK